jgi:autotransporter-associated beta strand protein
MHRTPIGVIRQGTRLNLTNKQKKTLPPYENQLKITMKPSILSTARLSFSLATALAALLAVQSASAQSGTWTQTTAGPFNWDDLANWSSGAGPIANGVDSTASFLANLAAAQTVNLNNAKTIGNITFTDTTLSSHDLTISGANTLTLDVTTGSPVISVTNADRTLSIASVVAGADGLTKSGPGILALSGTNTYSGVTSILNGRLAISTAGALGSTSSIILGTSNATTLSSGASGLTIAAPITTANTGVSSNLAFGVSANATGNFTLNGAIGGSGNVVFTTVGTSNNNLQSTILGAAGTYTGTTTITASTTANSNFVRAGINDALPTSTVLNINGGNGSGGGRVTAYNLNGFNQTLAGLTNTTGLSLRAQRVINTNATTLSTLTLNNSSDYSFSGNIGGNTNLGTDPVANNLALTKSGAGTFTLGNSNPYTGATLISGGTLRLATAGTINATSGITINGSTAKLFQTSSTAIAPTVTLTQGTVTGSGTVNAVNVGNATGGIVSNNDGVAGAALTIGALTFNGAATVNTFSNSASAPIATTSLATNAAGTVTINPSSASWAPGTYDLISYGGGSIGGAGFSQFVLGTVAGATTRQSKLLGDSGTAITLTVGADDSPYWAGDGDGTWNTSSANNWKLNSNNNPTTFLALDNAVFNDNATGSGPLTVNIDAADVTTTSTTFDNSTKNYILNSSSTFGISTGSLTKSGTGSLTLNTVNTFTGNTTITGGSLIIGGAGQLGGGTYAGAISNNGSFQYSSSANQTLSGIVSGTGSITQNGPGNLTLSGANGFSGGLEVKGGMVILSNTTAAGTGTIDFDTGGATNASVQFSGALTGIANSITVSSGSIGTNTVSTVGTGALVLNGAITLSSGTTLTVDNSSSNNSTIDLGAGLISGDGGIITTGTSTNSFVFRGASTYTGGTTLGGSGLFIPANSSTGSGAGTTDGPYGTGTLTLGTISMRSTNIADTTIGNTLVIAGNLTAVTAGSEKTLTFSGPATLTGNRTITSQVAASGKSLRFSGIIGDGGNNFGITKEGSGVLLLSGANTYAGTTTVNAGTLSITDNAALGSTAGATTINGGNGSNSVILSLSGAPSGLTIEEPLNFAGNTTGRARLSNDSAQNHTLSGPINVSSDTNLTQFYSDGSGSITISGDITGTMTNGAILALRGTSTNSLNRVTGSMNLTGDISKTDAGTWLLGAPGETYNWTNTVVAVGTLRMGLANVLPSTTILTLGNPTGGSTPILDLNGFNQTVAGITYNTQASTTGTRTITSSTSAVLTVDNATDSITTGASSGNNNIVLTGALGITKQGAGALTLNGVNTYSGNTTVNAGILSLTRAASPADANTGNDASTVTIAATTGATLDLAYTGTDEVDKLFIGGVQKAAGVWGAIGSGAPNTDAKITGTGTLTVATGPVAGYTSWASTNAGGEAANLDFDKDGVSNGVEFFMNAPAGFTANPQLNGSNSITWQNGGNIPASAYGTQFVIQTSTNLSTWNDVPVGNLTTNTDGPGGSVTYTLTGAAPRFVRMKVTPN